MMISLRKVRDICLCLLLTSLSFVSASSIYTSDIIPECRHLTVEAGQNYNSYIGTHGQRCCMCGKGTYLDGECNMHNPNSTNCVQCQYDEKVKSYTDFEPHMLEECMIDASTCTKPKIYVPGSSSSAHQCKCPDGTVEANHGFTCIATHEEVPPSSSVNQSSTLAVKYSSTTGSTHTIQETTSQTKAVALNGGKLTSVPQRGTTEAVSAPTTYMAEASNPEISVTASSESNVTGMIVPEVTKLNPVFVIALALSILLAFIAGSGACFITKYCKQCRRRGANIFSLENFRYSPRKEKDDDEESSDKEKSASPVELINIEESSPLINAGPAEESQHGSHAQPESGVQSEPPAPEESEGQVQSQSPTLPQSANYLAVEHEHSQPVSDIHTEPLVPTQPIADLSLQPGPPAQPVSDIPPEPPAPVQLANRFLLQTSDPLHPVSNVQAEPPSPAQPVNDAVLPVAPAAEDQKKLVTKVLMDMAVQITVRDLCQVGRDLLPEGREFEDIYDDKTITDRPEKARRIFIRAMELNPNLTLEDLQAVVENLAYLREIVTARIGADSSF